MRPHAKAAVLAAGTAAGLFVALLLGTVASEETPELSPAGGALDAAQVPAEYRKWVLKAAETCDAVSAPLIAAQIHQESGWNPDAVSPVGARGLSQFMPGTWDSWGVDADGDGRADPYSPPDAIMSQARYDCYLASQVDHLGGDQTQLMLAAYNAGPGAVLQYSGIPPYPETQHYVQVITDLIEQYTAAEEAPEAGGGPVGSRIVAAARRWEGTPYAWGGGTVTGPGPGTGHGAGTVGFDCSSLVQHAVYQATGGRITLPRTSQLQATEGKAVARGDLRPGDLIAFQMRSPSYDHIAIYAGSGQIIHAPGTGKVVRLEPLATYDAKPQTIRRIS